MELRDPAILFPRVTSSPSVTIHDYPRKYLQSVIRLLRIRNGSMFESDTLDETVGRKDFDLIREAIKKGDWEVFNSGAFHMVIHGITYSAVLSMIATFGFKVHFQSPETFRPELVANPKFDGSDLRLFDDVLVSLIRLYSRNVGVNPDIRYVVPLGSVSYCEVIVPGGDFMRVFENKFCQKRLAYQSCANDAEKVLLLMFKQLYAFYPLVFSGISGCRNCPNKNSCPQEP